MKIKLSCFEIEIVETVNCIKKYHFIEHKDRYVNGFTEIRKFGKFRYFIRHTVSKTYHVSNENDLEVYVKNFLRLNGY